MSTQSGSPGRPKRKTKEPRTPREFLRRDLRTIRIHLPRTDFAAIQVGAKQEFRNYGTRHFELETPMPFPAVGYCEREWWTPEHGRDAGIDVCLLTLTDSWVEPLGAISPESLAMEGFNDLGEFRRYFTQRYPKGGFRALANVIVYRVRPMTDEDREMFSARVWHHLYGRYDT